jgi:hypothetical protein
MDIDGFEKQLLRVYSQVDPLYMLIIGVTDSIGKIVATIAHAPSKACCERIPLTMEHDFARENLLRFSRCSARSFQK